MRKLKSGDQVVVKSNPENTSTARIVLYNKREGNESGEAIRLRPWEAERLAKSLLHQAKKLRRVRPTKDVEEAATSLPIPFC